MNMTDKMSDLEIKDVILGLLRSVNRPGIENLIDFLVNKSDFFTAPASTRFHLAESGGLARHSLNVYYRLCHLAKMEHEAYEYLNEDEYKAIQESLVIIALLHDICKCNFYKVSSRNVKNEQTGQWEKVPFYMVEDTFPMGHGEKSMYMVSCYIHLTRDEAMAIRWHMGSYDDAVKGGSMSMRQAFEKYPLAVLTHIADMQASNLDEKKKEAQ